MSGAFRITMGFPGGGRASKGGRPNRGTLPLLAALVFGILVFLPSTSLGQTGLASHPATWAPDPVAWTNGIVLCRFSASQASVSVSALAVNESGLSLLFASLEEVRPNGSVAAVADLARLTWTVTNRSTDDAYNLSFTVVAPLLAAPDSSTVVGSTDVEVDFVLPAYVTATSGSLDNVTVLESVRNWTWQSPGDSLAANWTAWSTFATQEHLVPGSAATSLLASRSNSTGADLERFAANSSARAVSSSGTLSQLPVTATAVLISPSSATVRLVFGAAGEFRSLDFSAVVSIVPAATVAGIPLSYLLAAAGAAAGVSLLLAGVTYRARRRRSDLIYVSEEETVAEVPSP